MQKKWELKTTPTSKVHSNQNVADTPSPRPSTTSLPSWERGAPWPPPWDSGPCSSWGPPISWSPPSWVNAWAPSSGADQQRACGAQGGQGDFKHGEHRRRTGRAGRAGPCPAWLCRGLLFKSFVSRNLEKAFPGVSASSRESRVVFYFLDFKKFASCGNIRL